MKPQIRQTCSLTGVPLPSASKRHWGFWRHSGGFVLFLKLVPDFWLNAGSDVLQCFLSKYLLFCGRISECVISTLENFTTSAIFLLGKESLRKGRTVLWNSSGGELDRWEISPRIPDSPEHIRVLGTFAAEAAASLPWKFCQFVFSDDERKEDLLFCCSRAENLVGLEIPRFRKAQEEENPVYLCSEFRKTLDACVQNSGKPYTPVFRIPPCPYSHTRV